MTTGQHQALQQQQQPSDMPLSLCMNSASLSQIPCIGSDQAIDSIKMMIKHEQSYMCRDYIDRRKQRLDELTDNDTLAEMSADETIDVVCREKMCEWSYRVSEHFHTGREVVAIAFTFLDRFVDRCSCDRTAFKLAAMTSLFMATKIFNSKQIAISSLVELSRGEFEMRHIAEMEKIILETLGWRLNPPTAQAYISDLMVLLPVKDKQTRQAILEQATFFAELAVYDYSFVTEDRLLIAISSVLNAVASVESLYSLRAARDIFIADLNKVLDLKYDCETLEHARRRLWRLYSCSAQMEEQGNGSLHALQWRATTVVVQKGSETGSHSPISVDMKGRL